jgi:hypothetical protein
MISFTYKKNSINKAILLKKNIHQILIILPQPKNKIQKIFSIPAKEEK